MKEFSKILLRILFGVVLFIGTTPIFLENLFSSWKPARIITGTCLLISVVVILITIIEKWMRTRSK
jgi:hypothetical protein